MKWVGVVIAAHTGMPVSIVAGVVKRYRERGSISVHDAPRSGHPTKISSFVQHQVESLVEENPRASLSEITEELQSLGLDIGQSTVDKLTKGLGFKLKVPRKKPLLNNFQKVRRRYIQKQYLILRLSIELTKFLSHRYWCQCQRGWKKEDWQRCVWLDEARVEYTAYQSGRKVRIRPGEELDEKNLAPSFQSSWIGVGFWAAFGYGRRTPLVRVHKRTPAERVTPQDRLGLNATQYATEIYDHYLIPFLLSSDTHITEIPVIEDGAKYHAGKPNREVTAAYKVQKLPLPGNSPDLNPIENAWHILKVKLQKRFTQNRWERPESEDALWKIMKEEWTLLIRIF